MQGERNSQHGAAVIRYDGKRGTVWRIKYRDAAGEQVMETIGAERDGVTRKDAAQELRERLVRVERKGYTRPKRLTFTEYSETWYEQGKRRRAWRPGTVKGYAVTLRRLRRYFGPLPIASIRPRDVAAFVSEQMKDYAPNTITRDLSVLHDIFNTALREELVESNPAARAERPKRPRRRWRILQPLEIQRVAREFTDDQFRVVFLTLVLTGIRSFELRALRWRDVDLVANVLRVAESKSEEGERAIALSPRLAEALWQHRRTSAFQGDGERVFCHPKTGGPLDPADFREALHTALRAAGITDYVRPFHDLRHTAITNDAAAGANPVALMTKAGHRNMSTTKTYLHLAGTVFPDEAERLEERLLGGSDLGRKFYPSEPISGDLSEPEPSNHAGY
jgi:integrase